MYENGILNGCVMDFWPVNIDNASIRTRTPAKSDDDVDPNDYLKLFEPKEEESVLLATGSADPYAYLYNVGEVRCWKNISNGADI